MNTHNPHGGGGAYDRDREREREERHRAAMQQQHEQEMAARRDQHEREGRESADRYQQQQNTPHHSSSAGSIPIHQPVASRGANLIHSPGGILGNFNGVGKDGPAGGAPQGSTASFGGPLLQQQQQQQQREQQARQAFADAQQHPMFAPMPHAQQGPGAGQAAQGAGAAAAVAAVFGGPLQQAAAAQQQAARPHQDGGRGGPPANGDGFRSVRPDSAQQAPPPPPPQQQQQQQQGAGGITQGQQPILNDALTYLDQVKVQFHDQPDVYNRFLDIMKDFKSQSIDTPGVINRVSELFAGNPSLIQGFNTFLPPGYRIECGAGHDPNTIRVTTPMGTTTQQIAGTRSITDVNPAPGQPMYTDRGAANNWQRPQRSIESPEAAFSTPVQNGNNLLAVSQGGTFDQTAAQQRNISQAPPTSQPVPRTQTPTPSAQALINGNAPPGSAAQKGPVEFNHAISYVNKIKNRFQDKPEIYKNFLEILQTYQRESRPIQDVYAQVTNLFADAPDLLESFKQFLPETKAVAERAEEGSRTPQPKMPPLGSFAPPASASKDSKKRPRATEKQGQAAGPAFPEVAANRAAPATTVNGTKRAKFSHARTQIESGVEPTLTPLMPEPYPPRPTSTSTADEMAFFERVKKYLGNRASMNEFLKMCNLFSQNIIDRETLYYKGLTFISANPELVSFWGHFVNYQPENADIANRPAPPTDKVSLSNCRGYGPSYRLLPKRERQKRCSGRDELCQSVLNDEWASHPTWASEDSGFVAHRKNQYEEGLHRIEEERHDYDFYIEANLKCIQLLEPIAQSMLAMSAEERAAFQMPAALAGQSTSIFKRIAKKIYGDRGIEVVNDLFNTPFTVVPILLARMKVKDEEWRFSQREWEKVWHTQTESMHLKSLDHMGILVKSTDKKNLTTKHLVDVIKTKHESQRRERLLKGKHARHQFVWDFADKDLISDLLRFCMQYTLSSGTYSTQEKERILEFYETFIPVFFDIPDELLGDRLPRMPLDSGEEDVEDQTPAELTNGRSRRNGRKADLLRGVLDPVRNTPKPRNQKEDSAASGSKETTPDVGSNEEDMPDAPDDAASAEITNERWMPTVPKAVVVGETDNANGLLGPDGELKADGLFTRTWYHLFCNQTIYVFMSIFQTLYSRLHDVKNSQDTVAHEIERLNREKPARDIGVSESPGTFFTTNDQPADFWPKTAALIDDYIAGDIDENGYQDVMRHYYLQNGWKLYTIQDLLKTLTRLALNCSHHDQKDKTHELINRYINNREKPETSYQTEISERKAAEKCVKDGELFVIRWMPDQSIATVRWLQRDESTFHTDDMALQERWQYYISSFIRVEPTEGIPRSQLQKVVLTRNLPSGDTDSDDGTIPKPLSFEENLTVSICLKSSKMLWEPGTSEYFVYDQSPKTKEQWDRRERFIKALSHHRETELTKKFVHNPVWARDMGPEGVQEQNSNFRKWLDEGVVPASASETDEGA